MKIDDQGVLVGDAPIPSRSVFWAAGVQAGKLSHTLGLPLDRSGRIIVNEDLSVPEFSEVFAVGDLAHFDLGEGKTLPGLAPAAIQTGRFAARNILRTVSQQTRQKFIYVDKGMMATIGKHRAVAETKHLMLTGYPAWLAWLLVHILYLVGFKNRIIVLFEWAWNYIFSKRGARLITSRNWKLER
jgi:NADH dehydrogenase